LINPVLTKSYTQLYKEDTRVGLLTKRAIQQMLYMRCVAWV